MIDLNKVKTLMTKTVDILKDQLTGMSDNVSENLISTVKVPCNGQQTPLEHLSLVSQKDRIISITPYDPGMTVVIERVLK